MDNSARDVTGPPVNRRRPQMTAGETGRFNCSMKGGRRYSDFKGD